MQMASPASVILRLMLEKGFVPYMQFLSLIVLHSVRTEIRTHLVSNYLPKVCDFLYCLKHKKEQHAIMLKPDILVFNLVSECSREVSVGFGRLMFN